MKTLGLSALERRQRQTTFEKNLANLRSGMYPDGLQESGIIERKGKNRGNHEKVH